MLKHNSRLRVQLYLCIQLRCRLCVAHASRGKKIANMHIHKTRPGYKLIKKFANEPWQRFDQCVFILSELKMHADSLSRTFEFAGERSDLDVIRELKQGCRCTPKLYRICYGEARHNVKTRYFKLHRIAYCYRRYTFRGLCVCLCIGHTGEPCKTAEPIKMLFGGRLAWAQETTCQH